MHINLLIYVVYTKSLQRYTIFLNYARNFEKKIQKTCIYANFVVPLQPEQTNKSILCLSSALRAVPARVKQR